MASKRWKCYIAAPPSAVSGALRSILRELHITPIDFVTAEPAPTALSAVDDAIRSADFLLLLLSPDMDSRWSMVEVGVAIGQGKRVLALIDGEAQLPADLAELPTVRVDLGSEDQLRFALAGFVELFDQVPTVASLGGLGKTQLAERTVPQRPSVGSRHTRPERAGHEFESRVADLLIQAGADAHFADATFDSGVDLVAWLPTTIPALGERLLIQVKQGALTRSAYDRAREQLRRQLRRSGLRAGLFVYSNSQGSVFRPTPGSPLVLTATIGELEQAVERNELVQFLMRQRNALVHS